MSIITFRVEDDLLHKIDGLVEQCHQTRSEFIRDAILTKLEDLTDVEAFIATQGDQVYSLDELKDVLDVAD